MGMRISGEVSIQKDERGVCKVTITNKTKDENGEDKVEFMKILAGFKKGVEVKNRARINIKDAFLTFFKVQEDEKYKNILKIIIMDFDVLEEGTDEPFVYKPKESKSNKQEDDWDWGSDDDLPF